MGFSVLALATVSAKLQLYFMEHPDEYTKAMAQLPESPEAVCNWFQQRWDFEGLPAVNKIIDETLGIFKEQARQKFPRTADYVGMAGKRCEQDCSTFMKRFPGYIFNSDGSGNYYDFPEDLKHDPEKTILQSKDSKQIAPSVQLN